MIHNFTLKRSHTFGFRLSESSDPKKRKKQLKFGGKWLWDDGAEGEKREANQVQYVPETKSIGYLNLDAGARWWTVP